jgi:uncharacterized protein (TIGR00297 family)
MSQNVVSPESRRHSVSATTLFPTVGMLLLLAIFCISFAWANPDSQSYVKGRLMTAALVTGLFAVAARLMRGVTTSGAIAGWCAAVLLWLRGGWQMLVVLVGVFVVTFAATRFGYSRKLRLGTAERRGGRDAGQVAANLFAPALLAVIAPPFWEVSVLASLCEVAADTVSSEVGQAVGGRPLLITSFRRVEPGTNGAISLWGTVAGIGGAAIIAVLPFAVKYMLVGIIDSSDFRSIGILIAAAIIGMFFDSILGATLERRGFINNNYVNGASTALAAFAANAFARYWF